MTDTPQIPHCRILRVLGEGGMGLVYEAEQLEPVRRRIAVKVLKAGLDTKAFIGRFEAERQALAVMDHPNIAKVYEAGATAEGRPYYAMEYVSGVPLTEYCDEQRLSTRDRVVLMVEVCGAIHHAHQKGILHRDLKPSNVLVASRDDKPEPKVIDFGIAKALTGRLSDRTFATDFGHPIGTPAYMSPEQWEAGQLDLDTRADIYSLGVMLYEVLVGRLPHDPMALARAGSVAASQLLREATPASPSTRVQSLGGESGLLAKVRNTDPHGLTRELRGDLDWITLKALEPDRRRRYETVHGLALDLGRYLRSEPVLARPPNAAYRVGRFVRRHRTGTAVAALVLLGGLGFTLLTAIQAKRVARERDRATSAAARATALNDFLQQTLLSPDPVNGIGKDATMQQALDSAVVRLRAHPIAAPEVDAAVKTTIGWAYFKLGLYDRAGPLLFEALAARRRIPHPIPEDLAESLVRAAALYDVRDQPDSAAALFTEALSLQRQVQNSDSRLAEALIRSGSFFGRREDTTNARSSFDEARAIYARVGDSAGVATAESHLGELAYRTGDLAGAERHFTAVLAYRKQHYGEHPLVAEALSNIGLMQEEAQHPEQAEQSYREAIRIGERTLGPDHDQVNIMVSNLALLLGTTGKIAEAETLFRRAAAADERKLGAESAALAADLVNLAFVSCRAGDARRGESAARRALAIFSKHGSPSGWEAAQTRVTLGRCLIRLQRYDEAQILLLAGRDGLSRSLGATHWRVDSARARLVDLDRARGGKP